MSVKKRAKSRATTKEETREALIDAGLALFGKEGLDGPSLDAICERAGYTRGAFYVHFRDRDDFLIAVMDRAGASFLDAVFATAGNRAGLAVTVRRFVIALESGDYPLTKKGGVSQRPPIAFLSTRVKVAPWSVLFHKPWSQTTTKTSPEA